MGDKDKDGTIDEEEFIQLLGPIARGQYKGSMRTFFLNKREAQRYQRQAQIQNHQTGLNLNLDKSGTSEAKKFQSMFASGYKRWTPDPYYEPIETDSDR